MKPPQSIDVAAIDPHRAVQRLRQAVKELEKQNLQLLTALDDRRELAEQVASAVVAAPAPKVVVPPRSPHQPEAHAVLKLSDWHIGERILASQTEGFGAFNWATAQARVANITQDYLKWIDAQRRAYNIRRLTVLCEGDFISGDIHEELRTTNEFPLPVQTARAGQLLGSCLVALSPVFEHVHVVFMAADNHSRLVRKPQAKNKVTNSMGYLVGVIAKAVTAQAAHLEWTEPESPTAIVTVGKHRWLTEHGDSIRGWGGHPYYGFGRRAGKEAIRRMKEHYGHFDYWSFAHWHVPAIIEGWWFVNGSLSGTSEFDSMQGRHSNPAQVGLLMGKHGVCGWVPFSGGAAAKRPRR